MHFFNYITMVHLIKAKFSVAFASEVSVIFQQNISRAVLHMRSHKQLACKLTIFWTTDKENCTVSKISLNKLFVCQYCQYCLVIIKQ